LFQGRPSSVADWMYLLAVELFCASISSVLPLPSWSLTSSKIGLPMI